MYSTHCISLLTTQLRYTLYIPTNSPASKYKHMLLNLGTIILTHIASTVCHTVRGFGHCDNAMELNVNICTPTQNKIKSWGGGGGIKL